MKFELAYRQPTQVGPSHLFEPRAGGEIMASERSIHWRHVRQVQIHTQTQIQSPLPLGAASLRSLSIIGGRFRPTMGQWSERLIKTTTGACLSTRPAFLAHFPDAADRAKQRFRLRRDLFLSRRRACRIEPSLR